MTGPLISQDALNENARLTILRELAAQPNGQLHSGMLHPVLRNFGHRGSREWVETQLYKLQDVGGVTLQRVGSVLLAHITHAGIDHITCSVCLAGVAAPSKASP